MRGAYFKNVDYDIVRQAALMLKQTDSEFIREAAMLRARGILNR